MTAAPSAPPSASARRRAVGKHGGSAVAEVFSVGRVIGGLVIEASLDGVVSAGRLTDGVVRILGPAGQTAGAGFVVSTEGLIATCAHVIGDGEPERPVTVVFQATGEARGRGLLRCIGGIATMSRFCAWRGRCPPGLSRWRWGRLREPKAIRSTRSVIPVGLWVGSTVTA